MQGVEGARGEHKGDEELPRDRTSGRRLRHTQQHIRLGTCTMLGEWKS